MDAQHKADLERILANRKANGRLKSQPAHGVSMASTSTLTDTSAAATAGTQYDTPYQQAPAAPSALKSEGAYTSSTAYNATPPATTAAAPPTFSYTPAAQRTSTVVTGGSTSSFAAAPQAQPSAAAASAGVGGRSPLLYTAGGVGGGDGAYSVSRKEETEVVALRRQLSDMQSKLAATQNEQTERLGELQEGLRAVQETLVAVATPMGGSTRQRSLARSAGMMQPVPRLVPDRQYAHHTHGASQPRSPAASVREFGGYRGGGPSPNEPSIVDFGSRFNIAGPPPPPEPPSTVRPYSTGSIDVESSVALLKTGSKFLKWSSTGSDVKVRYVWLDTATYVLKWGEKASSSNLFSNFVRIEEITDIQTTQLEEHLETGMKVYFILVIKTHTRILRIGTELRRKFDQWYEALSNVLLFCRTFNRVRTTMKLASSSD